MMQQNVSDLGRQMREALRLTVRRYSPFYLAQGILMIVLGLVALVYPLITSVALVVTLGWMLILHGVLQAIGVIGAKDVPYFWLQLLSAVLAGVVGLLLLSQPVEGVLVLSLLLIVFLTAGGMARVVFCSNDPPASLMGLAVAQWNSGHSDGVCVVVPTARRRELAGGSFARNLLHHRRRGTFRFRHCPAPLEYSFRT
jgi:uncharacterized membrane protein HdeD (DUF308 family)